MRTTYIVFVALITTLPMISYASLLCENLPITRCSYSVSSRGQHCVLQKEGNTYKCETSTMLAKRPAGRVPSESCINVCGLPHMRLGFPSVVAESSNNLSLLSKICSPACHLFCPDLFQYQDDLFLGTSLTDLCQETFGGL